MTADLTPEERAELFAPDRRLTAYYFSFDATGSPTIDAILSAVAIAGKGCHHTNGWTERDEWARWGEGRSLVDVIQAAADNAAAERDALAEWHDFSKAEIAELRAERDALAAKVERVRAEVRVLDLDGESRWRDWRDRADMYGQGASMAYEDAARRIRVALDGGES